MFPRLHARRYLLLSSSSMGTTLFAVGNVIVHPHNQEKPVRDVVARALDG